ncbi:MAG: hypothetical protein O9264_05635 [Leptospira sp.]|nr:hypothetical protein [Leptospira sp.]
MPWSDDGKYGSFKKVLIEPKCLEEEAQDIKDQILHLKQHFEDRSLPEASIAFQFVILFLKTRVGKRAYLKMGVPLPLETEEIAFLESVRFFGIPDTVRCALLNWMQGKWQIKLVNYHPTGKEMLYSQSLGTRLTTIDWDACLNGELIEDKRDAFEHLLHDLAHAFMFFREDYDFLGQVRFFQNMYEDFHHFERYLHSNDTFKQKFEYCISDMNSHPAHLEAYWNAIRREAGISV